MIAIKQKIVSVDLTALDKPCAQEGVIDCAIVLNSSLSDIFGPLFLQRASNIILADGGSNRIYDSPYRDLTNIRAIVGDLDSARQEVVQYYQQKKVQIFRESSQDNNDLEKALMLAIKLNYKTIAFLGILGGRIDQQLCNLSTLQKYSSMYKDMHFIGLGQSSLMYLVKSNTETRVRVSQLCHPEQCGLISFGKAKVQTNGYKWNLGQKTGLPQLSWGQLISSSNALQSKELTILSSEPIFCSFEFNNN